jgi:hypothetical protein
MGKKEAPPGKTDGEETARREEIIPGDWRRVNAEVVS